MSDVFAVIEWVGAILTVGAGVFVGLQLAAVVVRRAGRGVEVQVVRSGLVLTIVGVFVLLGAFLDDGPILEPWWQQFALLFGMPLLLAFVVGAAIARVKPPSGA